MGFDWSSDEDDAIFEESGIDVVCAFAVMFFFDNSWDEYHENGVLSRLKRFSRLNSSGTDQKIKSDVMGVCFGLAKSGEYVIYGEVCFI